MTWPYFSSSRSESETDQINGNILMGLDLILRPSLGPLSPPSAAIDDVIQRLARSARL